MAPLPGRVGGDAAGKLNKAKVLNETSWCLYCCCEGVGCGPCTDPCCAAEVKDLCCRSSVSTTDICASDGCCNFTDVLCCLTRHYQFPPAEGSPTFALCNLRCCGSCGSTDFHAASLFGQKQIIDDTFWLFFCLCAGCGCNACNQGCCATQSKFCCCRAWNNVEPPIVDGVCCSSVATECCCWTECQMPPARPNPTIACCTWRCNKEEYVCPDQMEMQ